MVSKDEIKRLGWLARLDLSEQELSKYESQVDRIIQYFDILDDVALELEPDYLKKCVSVLRTDRAEDFGGNILPKTKDKKDGYLKGPRTDVRL